MSREPGTYCEVIYSKDGEQFECSNDPTYEVWITERDALTYSCEWHAFVLARNLGANKRRRVSAA